MADVNPNQDIEMFLVHAGALEIYGEWGLGEYFRFLNDMRMKDAGFSYSEIGYKERKDAQSPKLIEGDILVEDWKVRDETNTPPGSIAILSLSGVMQSQSTLCTDGVDSLIRDSRAIYQNKNLIGAIVDIDSGGGDSGAGTKLKSAWGERNKPFVALGHLVASAAYRAASTLDEIIASSASAEFGSIGTMISMDRRMLEYYKQTYLDFYGESAPGKNSAFRDAVQGKFDGIQKIVTDKSRSFQAEIAKDRNLRGSEQTIQETLNGQVFDALQAKRRGLVDMVGNMNDAVRRVKALQGKYKRA